MPILGIVGVALLVLWVFCLVDVITTSEWECRNLPKSAWLLIVLLVPSAGSVIWLIAGRPRPAPAGTTVSGATSGYPEYDRPGRHVATDPEDDEEFLRRCRERAEAQRREAARRRPERE
ncbi:membrane protein [Longimycelium tulufanense]|uniref:Membrane protein n=1 Tax=Longimycelium tulufanense TaxID=907463 RepID=A0A8J3FSL7_9PSEU|nr:PLD nuclease N-terminal domain-containing protein [Longimycelium tulufanense]GGM37041.1 membrane protein [Longimycelium tulufanense]